MTKRVDADLKALGIVSGNTGQIYIPPDRRWIWSEIIIYARSQNTSISRNVLDLLEPCAEGLKYARERDLRERKIKEQALREQAERKEQELKQRWEEERTASENSKEPDEQK